jgi:hypothetical protein
MIPPQTPDSPLASNYIGGGLGFVTPAARRQLFCRDNFKTLPAGRRRYKTLIEPASSKQFPIVLAENSVTILLSTKC